MPVEHHEQHGEMVYRMNIGGTESSVEEDTENPLAKPAASSNGVSTAGTLRRHQAAGRDIGVKERVWDAPCHSQDHWCGLPWSWWGWVGERHEARPSPRRPSVPKSVQKRLAVQSARV